MTLTIVTFCFLVAAIIFFLDAIFGYVGGETWGRYHGGAISFAFGLIATGLLLWKGGK